MAAQVAAVVPAATHAVPPLFQYGLDRSIAAQVAENIFAVPEPTATHVWVSTEHLVVPAVVQSALSVAVRHSTQALEVVSHLTKVAEMAAQVVSSEPAATHALSFVDHVGVAVGQATQAVAVESHFGLVVP
jgi:hypothetical protein